MDDNSNDHKKSKPAKVLCPFCGSTRLDWSRLSNQYFCLDCGKYVEGLEGGVLSEMEDAFKKCIIKN